MEMRNRLHELLFLEFVDPKVIPRGKQFIYLVQIIWEELPDVEWEVLEDSLRSLAGSLMTSEMADEVAWRIAGNIPLLQYRTVVAPWTMQLFLEWVPVEIRYCRRMKNKYHRHGVLLGFLVQAGSCCSRMVYKWWSLKQCRFYSRGFGFSCPTSGRGRRTAKYPYTVPEQLVHLRCYVLIEPKLCVQKEPRFNVASWPSSVREWNKETLRCRFRVDPGYVCPEGHLALFPCHFCPLSLLECRGGTHLLSWVQKYCPECKNNDAFFDPELPDYRCLDCFRKGAFHDK